jgi:hypothetical protein
MRMDDDLDGIADTFMMYHNKNCKYVLVNFAGAM